MNISDIMDLLDILAMIDYRPTEHIVLIGRWTYWELDILDFGNIGHLTYWTFDILDI